MRQLLACVLFFLALPVYANSSKVVNIYTWSSEIPSAVIAQFEKETGIKVNTTTFDSNEMMYAKLKASPETDYDLIETL